MSQLIVIPPPPQQQQFDKIWKMFDDCIKTGKFTQITDRLFREDVKRCALGVIMSYTGVTTLSELLVNTEKFYTSVCPQYKLSKVIGYGSYPLYELENREQVVKYLKGYYEKTDTIGMEFITVLNDCYQFTFEDFRDLFKEMDV
jgi:hypothetical protein